MGLRGTLDALIESAAFERLLLERARPVLASAETAEDAVLAAVAVALDSPVMAVAAGPREAECLAAASISEGGSASQARRIPGASVLLAVPA